MAGNGTTPSGKLVSGDLDASLANLTSNLNLNAGHGKWVLLRLYLIIITQDETGSKHSRFYCNSSFC